MNSTKKRKFMSPTLNKTYVSIIINYSYTTSKTHHHAGKFLPNQKVFFRMTSPWKLQSWGRVLQAMVLAGSSSLLKWRDLLKANPWSKQRQKLVTQSYSHSNRLMATRYKYLYTPRSVGNSYAEYPPPHWLKYPKILWGISVYIWET